MGWADSMADMVKPTTEDPAQRVGQIKLATMTGPNSLKIGELQLTGEDLLIEERLTKTVCTKVDVPESHKDKSAYMSALKAGDQVAVIQISDSKVLVLGKMVSV